jgi:hypothetical protein
MMLSLDAPASSLWVSETSSDIQFGERNPALLCTDITACWLRNDYSVRLIIPKLEQVVTHWNAMLFHLLYGWSIYRPVCLFLYIKLSWNCKPSGDSHHQLNYGKIVTSQGSQQLLIFICVGEFMHPVYLIFQTVVLELNRNWTEM